MKNARRARLCLEALESRFCPSLTIHSTSGTLLISGTPKGNMVVTEPQPNLFKITDNGANDGTFTADNIYFNFTSKANKALEINLDGNTLGGNLVINAGTGLEVNPGTTGTGIRNGRIGGSVTETGGSGNEVLALGTDPAGHNPANLTIGGDVTFAPSANNSAPNSNVLDTNIQSDVVIIGGNVTTTNTGTVRMGPNTTVGKNVSVSAGQKVALTDIEFDGATIKGNLSVTGSTGGSNVQLDGINFGFATGPQIGGSVTANLGSGNNTFDLDDGTVVSGNVNVTGGGGSDTYFIDGVVNGSLTANTGNGATSFETGSDPGFASIGSVGGNLSLTEGNGTNMATTLDGTVGGNLTITQGNGDNSAGVVVGTAPGGLLTYKGGNGIDSLTLGNTGTAAFWNVYITFGTGMNTLTLNPSGLDTYSGTVIGNGGANTFNQNGDTLVNMNFVNFP